MILNPFLILGLSSIQTLSCGMANFDTTTTCLVPMTTVHIVTSFCCRPTTMFDLRLMLLHLLPLLPLAYQCL